MNSSPETSSLGTVVKAPMKSASEVVVEGGVSEWWWRWPDRAGVEQAAHGSSAFRCGDRQEVAEPLKQVKFVGDEPWMTTAWNYVGRPARRNCAVVDEGEAGLDRWARAVHRIDRAWHRPRTSGPRTAGWCEVTIATGSISARPERLTAADRWRHWPRSEPLGMLPLAVAGPPLRKPPAMELRDHDRASRFRDCRRVGAGQLRCRPR